MKSSGFATSQLAERAIRRRAIEPVILGQCLP